LLGVLVVVAAVAAILRRYDVRLVMLTTAFSEHNLA